MKSFIVYTPNGEIVSAGYCLEAFIQEQAINGNLAMEGTATYGIHYINDAGEVIELPPKLNPVHAFNYDTKEWEDARGLVQAKVDRKNYISSRRLIANRTSFTYLGKEIAVDRVSRGDIDAIQSYVTMTGEFPTSWPGAWKAIDNSYVSITTVPEWQAFFTAMVNQGTINFNHSQSLKAAIEVATTISDVDLINW